MSNFFGGKNSVFNKPLGTGKSSVNKGVENIIGKGAKDGLDSYASFMTGSYQPGTRSAGKVLNMSYGNPQSVAEQTAKIRKEKEAQGLKKTKGEQIGESITGTTIEGVGQGRASIRKRLQGVLDGDSAGANTLRQDQLDTQRNFKAKQLMAGGGQMNVGQQQALKRQANIDYGRFVSDEKRKALSDLSREFRGAGGDILRSAGQYGALAIGQRPAAVVREDRGWFS